MAEINSGNKAKKPRGKIPKILFNIFVTIVAGGIYYYAVFPPINMHAGEFYTLIGFLCVVYCICAAITSGTRLGRDSSPREYFTFLKKQCLPVVFLFLALIVIGMIGGLFSAPILRAGDYQALLTVEEGDFSTDVSEVSFDEIPMLDEMSAQRLGDRKLGELSDMVSQFEVSGDYTQINYQGRPVRVACLEYGDFFKWLNNRDAGLPAYIYIDMVTQEVEVVRLSELGLEGIKYSPTEVFNRKLERHLQFHYPTFMFTSPTFELDESGHPYWVCPKLEKTIGLFGGDDINGAVLVDAITGECTYYEEVPSWVDRVYTAEIIMQQYDYHGTYQNGFLNSIFGQKDVTVTTSGYNYVAMGDDVYMYTGVTSVGSDESNIGFLLSNQRTKETTYYSAPGAIETSAQASAEGVVQDLGYTATFPLLLNVSGEPTYFMSLKDASQLVKLYAMVNVAQYQVVATGTTVAECESNYISLLNSKGIITEAELPQTETSGTIEEIRTAVMDGNSYYFIRLQDQDVFFSISASEYPIVVVLNVGDRVKIEHQVMEDGSAASILDGYAITKY